ncbi:MAG: hypothetical protein ACD_23C00556G0001 [uncultured bacterium]|nr:MAG: hypothetical protein ACD_23C00556G0001 [uncultured bacterium]
MPRSSASAWVDNGTMWSAFIFILAPGMRHSAVSRSTSDHSIVRSSPGRTNTSGVNRRATTTLGWPL